MSDRWKDEDRVKFIFIYIPVFTVSLARRREQAALYPPIAIQWRIFHSVENR